MQPLAKTIRRQPSDVGNSREEGREENLDVLVQQAVEGDIDAWGKLVAIVHPLAVRLCGYQFNPRPSQADDVCHEVASLAIARLQRDEFGALKRYLETRENYPQLIFESWFRVVVRNIGIDQLRAIPENQRVRKGETRAQVSVAVHALDIEPASDQDLQRQVEVRRILEWLADPEFPDDQRQALFLWLRGHDAAEVARILGLEHPRNATRLLRAGRQRLRRQFEDPK